MKLRNIVAVVATLTLAVGVQAQKTSLRVMTYDVHNGVGSDKVHSYDRIAEVITAQKPNVIALQEMDSVTTRFADYVLGEIAERTGMHSYYAPAINYAGGKYGVGILSDSPALSVRQYPLPCPSEPRTLLIVEFENYYFGCTHLPMNATECMAAVLRIEEIVTSLDKPFLLGGNINAEPHDAEIQKFREFATILTPTDTPTWNELYPGVQPNCIDYIFYRGDRKIKVRNAQVLQSIAAEHLPLVVDVKF